MERIYIEREMGKGNKHGKIQLIFQHKFNNTKEKI